MQSNSKHHNSSNPQKIHHQFQVTNTPKGLFPLFKGSDPYIYEKKFCCDLPMSIVTPKCFHSQFSWENFCLTDLLTMSFDLRKNAEILTDPNMNNVIHQDFINNSLELIRPNLTKTRGGLTNEEEKKLLQDILGIIERNDDTSNEKKNTLTSKPLYLRTSKYFSPTLNVGSDNTLNISKSASSFVKDKTPLNVKEQIWKTFDDIKSITFNMKHPTKENWTAKNIYNIVPNQDYIGLEMIQYIFPIDPNKEVQWHSGIKTPERFIIRKNNDNEMQEYNTSKIETVGLFKKEELATNETNEVTNTNNTNNKAEYYTHEKEYNFSLMNPNETFNRYIITLDKAKKVAKFVPWNKKISLSKYKKATIKRDLYDNNENNRFLQHKKERDILWVPTQMEESELISRNKIIKQYGFIREKKNKVIDQIDYTDVEKLKVFKEGLERQQLEDNDNNNDQAGNKEEVQVEDDNLNEDISKSFDDKSHNTEENGEDDIDALFGEDGEEGKDNKVIDDD